MLFKFSHYLISYYCYKQGIFFKRNITISTTRSKQNQDISSSVQIIEPKNARRTPVSTSEKYLYIFTSSTFTTLGLLIYTSLTYCYLPYLHTLFTFCLLEPKSSEAEWYSYKICLGVLHVKYVARFLPVKNILNVNICSSLFNTEKHESMSRIFYFVF